VVPLVELTTAPVKAPRVGLYKPWAASMDEGWTRFILDQYEFKYATLDNSGMKNKNLRSRFDVIILPDIDKNVIIDGKEKRDEALTSSPCLRRTREASEKKEWPISRPSSSRAAPWCA
jgi:hypothetical protein